MIRNEEGLVGVTHWDSNESQYTRSSFNVSLGWVREEDLPKILAIKVMACCGVNRNKYRLSSESEVSVWKTGHN